MPVLARETVIPAPRREVFAFFENQDLLSPRDLDPRNVGLVQIENVAVEQFAPGDENVGVIAFGHHQHLHQLVEPGVVALAAGRLTPDDNRVGKTLAGKLHGFRLAVESRALRRV